MSKKKKLIETCTFKHLAEDFKLHPYTLRRLFRGEGIIARLPAGMMNDSEIGYNHEGKRD